MAGPSFLNTRTVEFAGFGTYVALHLFRRVGQKDEAICVSYWGSRARDAAVSHTLLLESEPG